MGFEIPQFHGGGVNVATWLADVEQKAKEDDTADPLPEAYRSLEPNVLCIIQDIERRLGIQSYQWTWKSFQEALMSIEAEICRTSNNQATGTTNHSVANRPIIFHFLQNGNLDPTRILQEFLRNPAFLKFVEFYIRNQQLIKGIGIGLGIGVAVGGVVLMLTPPILTGLLGVIGFSAIGPVAGSLAALIQSAYYGGAIASGSFFAIMQGLAMGGIAAASGAIVTAGAAVTAVGVGVAGTVTGAAVTAGALAPSTTFNNDYTPIGQWDRDFRVSEEVIVNLRSLG